MESLDTKIEFGWLTTIQLNTLGYRLSMPALWEDILVFIAWSGLKRLVHSFVSKCSVCQQVKPEHVKYPGLLQPLPVPDYTWQVVSLDFIEGLPTSKNCNCILVVVDKIFQICSFCPTVSPFYCHESCHATYGSHIQTTWTASSHHF